MVICRYSETFLVVIYIINAAHIDNLLHLQQHHICQLDAEKHIITDTCTKEFLVNRRLTHFEEETSLKALSNPTLPLIL